MIRCGFQPFSDIGGEVLGAFSQSWYPYPLSDPLFLLEVFPQIPVLVRLLHTFPANMTPLSTG
jgi:hypothetical protein